MIEKQEEVREVLHKFHHLFIAKLESLPYLNIVTSCNVDNLISELQGKNFTQIFVDAYKYRYIVNFTFLVNNDKLEPKLNEKVKDFKERFNKSFVETELFYHFYNDFYDMRFIEAIKKNSSDILLKILSEDKKRAFELKSIFSYEPITDTFNKIRIEIEYLMKRIREESGITEVYEFISKEITRVYNETETQLRNEFLKCGIKYFTLYSQYEPF